MKSLYWVLMVCTAFWVGLDANRLGVKKGRLRGNPLDLSIALWVTLSLALPVIGLPCYLLTRGKYRAIRSASLTPAVPVGTPPAVARD